MALIASTALLVLTLAQADDVAPRPVPSASQPAASKDAKPPLRRPEFAAKKRAASSGAPFPTGLRNPFNEPSAAATPATPPTKAATLSGELKNPFPNQAKGKTSGAKRPRTPAPLATAGDDLQDPFPAQTPLPTGQQAPLPTGLKNPFVDPGAKRAAPSSTKASAAPSSPPANAKPTSSSTEARCRELPATAVDAHAPVPCPPSSPQPSRPPATSG